jgi:hypothetical protein
MARKKDTGRKVSDPRSDGSAERLTQIAVAKQQFMDAALNMGWQLAVTIIVPVYIGVRLDDHFHSSPSWTLGALFLAVFMSCGVVWKALHGVTVAQSKTGNNKEIRKKSDV